jgi:DNA-binding HxlR family transcriptional regulator
VGDKWTPLLVRELTAGPKRFSELEQALSIGPRTLSQRLDALEAAGVVRTQPSAAGSRRLAYVLTPKGEDLLPVLYSMAEWAAKYA